MDPITYGKNRFPNGTFRLERLINGNAVDTSDRDGTIDGNFPRVCFATRQGCPSDGDELDPRRGEGVTWNRDQDIFPSGYSIVACEINSVINLS